MALPSFRLPGAFLQFWVKCADQPIRDWASRKAQWFEKRLAFIAVLRKERSVSSMLSRSGSWTVLDFVHGASTFGTRLALAEETSLGGLLAKNSSLATDVAGGGGLTFYLFISFSTDCREDASDKTS